MLNRPLILIYTLITVCIVQPVWAQHREMKSNTSGLLSIPVKVNAYFFKSKSHGLLVLDEGAISQPKFGSLDRAMANSTCLAGVNASYFGADAKGTPLGLSVSGGKIISPFASEAFTVSGIVYDTGTEITLMRSKSFATLKTKPKMADAIQGGPFLVEGGKMIAGLNDKRSTFRTFIATNGKGDWCIGVSSPVTLAALSKLLTQQNFMGDFHVQNALNLDGGSSSALWVKSPKDKQPLINFPHSKRVRNYIGVSPRTNK